ncbi:hypothetical protein D3C79_979570 [compost metagenome]
MKKISVELVPPTGTELTSFLVCWYVQIMAPYSTWWNLVGAAAILDSSISLTMIACKPTQFSSMLPMGRSQGYDR